MPPQPVIVPKTSMRASARPGGSGRVRTAPTVAIRAIGMLTYIHAALDIACGLLDPQWAGLAP
ncbi:hypothetical protein ACFXKC_14995 [Streptomyces sp. NPDC059340]|uniref:hypothetical protein n=1 Tax=Streptomyces sp. NPDC059340 TaxID=3346806 RepID=UPI0036A120B2